MLQNIAQYIYRNPEMFFQYFHVEASSFISGIRIELSPNFFNFVGNISVGGSFSGPFKHHMFYEMGDSPLRRQFIIAPHIYHYFYNYRITFLRLKKDRQSIGQDLFFHAKKVIFSVYKAYVEFILCSLKRKLFKLARYLPLHETPPIPILSPK